VLTQQRQEVLDRPIGMPHRKERRLIRNRLSHRRFSIAHPSMFKTPI